MKIGLALPVSGSWATPEHIRGVAQRADELGYQSLWTFQRLLSDVDNQMGEMYRAVHDPLVVLAFAAAVTQRARLGVAVVNAPFVSPLLLAKQAATLDLLSGGRLDLGIGLGWSEPEYVASGTTMADRGRRLGEFVQVLRTLWSDEVVEHHGEFYEVPASRLDPKPRQPIPVLLGGTAPAALRRAGRIGDGWVSGSRADLTAIRGSIEVVRRAAAEAGRDPELLRFVCRGAVKVRPDQGPDRAPLTGTVEQIRADLARLAEQGITETFLDLNFDPEIGSPDANPDVSRSRAEDVITAFAPLLT